MEMITVTSSFADGPVNFNPTGPVEDQAQKLISSTARGSKNLVAVLRINLFVTGWASTSPKVLFRS